LSLKNYPDQRHEFSTLALKWSINLFNDVKKINSLNEESVLNHNNNLLNYQKTFGHTDLHDCFAINLWKGNNNLR
jgi:hypothetical protein